ncbi:MAG: hypothetical protein FWE49_00895 [Synergistaceae bacterium]|nr:hypothetical protein [Synergistaceae bacterium]
MIIRVRFYLFLVLLVIALFPVQKAETAGLQPINILKVFNEGVPQINLMEMVQECPHFTSYPAYNGIIWLKQHTYQIDVSGSMSITTAWVILGKSEIDRKWLEWNIPIPKDGDAQIYEASLYDPGSLMQIGRISPQKKIDEWHVNFGAVPEEFIIVLSYRQTYARSIAIQGMLWLHESLPIWEQTIIARVEAGRDFEYVTNAEIEPTIISEGNLDIYRWMIVNQMPSSLRSLRTDLKSWLAFGNRQPLSSFVRLLESYAKMPTPTPPSNVEVWLKKGDMTSFFNWLTAQETDNTINTLREEIPQKAPWSKWEKSIIASSWINRFQSDQCRLFWRLAVDPFQNGFANESIILAPAIEMKRKNDVFFYEIGQPYEQGVTSLSLIGEALYAPLIGDNKLEKRVIPPRGASDNRLSIVWNLNVEENNTITGSVSMTIRNLWKEFLLFDTDVNSILPEIVKAVSGRDINTKSVKGAVEISAPLRPSKIILDTSGTNAIISLNPPQPDWLRDLAMAMAPYSIKFPFSIEAIYAIELPENVKDILLPSQIDRDFGKIKYSEKYEYSKRRRRLNVTARLTFSSTKVDQAMEQDVAFALGRFGTQRSVPVRMK